MPNPNKNGRQGEGGGQPSQFEGREMEFIESITNRLERGEPLLCICRDKGMPSARTIYRWMEEMPEVAARFAQSRLIGFDAIAAECLEIADETSNDTITTEKGAEMPNSEWIARSKLRVETRLKLLAKWDPKRYGDATPTQNVTVGVAITSLTEDRRAELMAKKRQAIQRRLTRPALELPPTSNGTHA